MRGEIPGNTEPLTQMEHRIGMPECVVVVDVNNTYCLKRLQ